jgi:peroxiredoxin
MTDTKRSTGIVLALLAALILGVSTNASAEGKKKFTKKDLPAAVTSAFEKAYPKATIKGASKEKENNTTYYEIESVDGTTKRDLLYTADGTIAEIEENIEAKDVPEAVAKTLKSDYGKYTIEKSEKVMRGSDTKYEFIVKKGKNRSEIVLDGSGKVVKTEKKSAAKEKGEENEKEENEKE